MMRRRLPDDLVGPHSPAAAFREGPATPARIAGVPPEAVGVHEARPFNNRGAHRRGVEATLSNKVVG